MPEAGAPTLSGLFRDKISRRAVLRYWVFDTAQGLLNLAVHNGLKLLPTEWTSRFGAVFAAVLGPYRFPNADARARELWRVLRPEQSAPIEVDAAMRRLWRSVGRTMAEYSVLHRLVPQDRIEVVGREHMEAELAAGRTVIFACVHLGNWEAMALKLQSFGYPIAGTYDPPSNRFDHRIVNQVRRRFLNILTPDRRGGIAAFRTLVREKQMVAFFVDEIFQGRVSAPAFGRKLRIEGNIANVARLARMANAAVMVAYCVRLGDAVRFRMTGIPVPQARTADAEADLIANVAAIERTVAPIVRDHVDQWYYALDFKPDAETA